MSSRFQAAQRICCGQDIVWWAASTVRLRPGLYKISRVETYGV